MTATPARNAQTAALEALIEAHAIELKLPTVRRRFRALAAEALREQQTPVAYLGALLEAEMNERAERRERRRLIDARFPQIKRLDDFRFADNTNVPQATIAALAEGSSRLSRSASCSARVALTRRGALRPAGERRRRRFPPPRTGVSPRRRRCRRPPFGRQRDAPRPAPTGVGPCR